MSWSGGRAVRRRIVRYKLSMRILASITASAALDL
jgi:hypothetical protein